jgi:hypothetical protein
MKSSILRGLTQCNPLKGSQRLEKMLPPSSGLIVTHSEKPEWHRRHETVSCLVYVVSFLDLRFRPECGQPRVGPATLPFTFNRLRDFASQNIGLFATGCAATHKSSPLVLIQSDQSRQYTPPPQSVSSRFIFILSTHPRLGSPSGLFLLEFQTIIYMLFCFPHSYYMSRPSYPP